jgi:phosphoribosylamine---glycine ligase
VLLEHNVRFGDPECEALMALLEGDVAELLASAARGALRADAARVAEGRHAIAVVLAASGYPGAPRTGDPIQGLEAAAAVEGVVVNHAGTTERDGEIVTAGGRVLAITATAGSLPEARERAYRASQAIEFEGKVLRRDIGAEPAPIADEPA